MFKKVIIIILTILLLVYLFLRGNEINLEKKLLYETYENLPQEVKIKYAESLESKDTAKIFSLDKNFSVEHYWTGLHKQMLIKGFREHIIINEKYKFKLDANKGEPFILHNKTLYFPVDLNFHSLNSPRQTRYYKIDLKKYIE